MTICVVSCKQLLQVPQTQRGPFVSLVVPLRLPPHNPTLHSQWIACSPADRGSAPRLNVASQSAPPSPPAFVQVDTLYPSPAALPMDSTMVPVYKHAMPLCSVGCWWWNVRCCVYCVACSAAYSVAWCGCCRKCFNLTSVRLRPKAPVLRDMRNMLMCLVVLKRDIAALLCALGILPVMKITNKRNKKMTIM